MHLSTPAPAKVNLSLLVGPRRADGYHELFSVFAPLDLHDRLSFTLSLGAAAQRPGELTLDCPTLDAGADPDPERNLAVRALRALEGAAGRAISGSVRIEKNIPVGAGLGGGSSDAAAALLAGARLLAEEGGVVLAPEVLHSLAVSLGADVPFFLGQGACRRAGDRRSVAAHLSAGDSPDRRAARRTALNACRVRGFRPSCRFGGHLRVRALGR